MLCIRGDLSSTPKTLAKQQVRWCAHVAPLGGGERPITVAWWPASLASSRPMRNLVSKSKGVAPEE